MITKLSCFVPLSIDKIGWETFIDGQTDGVLFYMNNGKKFCLMYDEIDAIERGYPCRKNWLS